MKGQYSFLEEIIVDNFAGCANLDMSKKQWDEDHYCYRYGCSKEGGDGFICFWCRKDSQLKEGGCSGFTDTNYEQLTLF